MLQEEGHCHERGPIYGRGVPLQDAPGLATRALNTPHDRWELVRLHTFDNRDDASVRFASMHGSATLSGRTEEVDVSGLKRQPKEGLHVVPHLRRHFFRGGAEGVRSADLPHPAGREHVRVRMGGSQDDLTNDDLEAIVKKIRAGLCHINHHVAVHSMVSRI